MKDSDKNQNMSYQKLDAVLPLTVRDLERFKILQKSLNLFCQDLLSTVWIVVPDAQQVEISKEIKLNDYRIISESILVPETRFFKIQGWYLQQLIKLEIANYVKTDFYLTLDADVICTKPTTVSDLIKDGRAVYYANSSKERTAWDQSVWKILQITSASSLRYNYYNVTPAVLSKCAVIQLQKHLQHLSRHELAAKPVLSGSRSKKLLLLKSWLLHKVLPAKSGLRHQFADYRAYLIRHLPWTEYMLYYNFCDVHRLLDKYHVWSPQCIYAGRESVWQEQQFESWNPANCFEGERNFFFCVLQSNTQIPAEAYWQKIEKYFHEQP